MLPARCWDTGLGRNKLTYEDEQMGQPKKVTELEGKAGSLKKPLSFKEMRRIVYHVMFAWRTLQEWDPIFIENVKRDGIVLFAQGKLPAPFAA